MDITIYTDGHDVKVTNTQFIAGQLSYQINGITDASVRLIKAVWAPAILLIIAGIAGIITGITHMYSFVQMSTMYIGSIPITPNRLAVIVGAAFALIGIVWCMALHDKYAVHIVTAEGEKDPVVSSKKDYVSQIVSALQSALSFR